MAQIGWILILLNHQALYISRLFLNKICLTILWYQPRPCCLVGTFISVSTRAMPQLDKPSRCILSTELITRCSPLCLTTLPTKHRLPNGRLCVRWTDLPVSLMGIPNLSKAPRIIVLEDTNSLAICLKEHLSNTYFWWRTASLKVIGSVLSIDMIVVFGWRTFPVPGSRWFTKSAISGAIRCHTSFSRRSFTST